MLNKDRLGLALWNRVKSDIGPYTPSIGPTQESQGLQLWTGVADEIIKELITNAVIPVSPGTFVNGGGPVAGIGQGVVT